VSIANERLLLVTGYGRSGTKYISFALRRLGLDVPHERRDGDPLDSLVPGHPAARSTHEVEFRRRTDHVGPDVAPRLSAEGRRRSDGVERMPDLVEDLREAHQAAGAVRAPCRWAGEHPAGYTVATWHYRIEALPEFARFCECLGGDADPSALSRVPTDVSTRRGRALHLAEELLKRLHLDMPTSVHAALMRPSGEARVTPMRWRDIERADPDLAIRVRVKAHECGYER
jgi:hypothetical protein